MSEASQGAKCVVCGQLLSGEHGDCPSCGVSDAWRELIQAMEFAQSRFEQWAKDQTIGGGPLHAITQDYNQQRQTANRMAREGRPLPSDAVLMPADRCWNCRAAVIAGREHCGGCGVPVSRSQVQTLRYWTYTCHRIKSHCDAGRLPLVQAHACMNDAKSRDRRAAKSPGAGSGDRGGGGGGSRRRSEAGRRPSVSLRRLRPIRLPAPPRRGCLASRFGKSSSIRARSNGCWALAACCWCSDW